MSINTNEIAAVTKQVIEDIFIDGLETSTALLKWLSSDGKKTFDGGTLIQFPIKLIANQAQGWISGTNALVDTTPSQQFVYGTLNVKYANFNTNFTLQDYALNNGDNAVRDLIADKAKGSVEDMIRFFNAAAHGTSTTNALAWEGLKDIVATTGTAYAGLTDTDYTGSPTSAAPYLPVTTTDTLLNYANITKMMYQVRARMQAMGTYKRVFGIMNPATFSKYMGILQGQQLAVNTSDTYFSGFDGFKINGVEFYMDVNCPGSQDGSTADNYVYIIPMDVLKLWIRFGKIFGATASPFDREVPLPNSPIISIQNYIAGNMVCNNRRLIAVNKTFIA